MGVKNTLGDMHSMMMEELQRLNECEPGSDEQKNEVERAHAMANVSKQIVSNANLMLKAARETQRTDVPKVLVSGD